MNAIVKLETKNKDSRADRLVFLDSLHEQGAIFDVDIVDNYYPVTINGKIEFRKTGLQSIRRSDNHNFIAANSGSYNAFQNREIFTAMDRQIAKSNVDLTGAHTKVTVSPDSKRVAVQYLFPAHEVETARGDKTCLQIIAINSFDCSTSFHVHLGALRGFCMNTQVFGTSMIALKIKHNQALELDRIAEVIGRGIDVFNAEGEIWKTMTRNKMTDETVYAALADMAGVSRVWYPTYESYVSDRRQNLGRVYDNKLDNYFGVYRKYARELGETEFALYNALTHISSHGAKKGGEEKLNLSYATFNKRVERVQRVATKHLKAYKQAA
jgi:hypothetical protein